MYMKKQLMLNHIKEHATVYLFMVILFLTGVVFGAVIVNSMGFAQKQDLAFYLDRFFDQLLQQENSETKTVLMDSFLYHIKYILLLFILGLSVIGLPLVWVLLFTKGLVVGFTVGFIVNQLSWNGLLLSALSIAPQNLIIIPIYLAAGSLSMIFSLTLLHRLFSRNIRQSILRPLGVYAGTFAVLLMFSFIAALLEAFIAHQGMKVVVKALYSAL
ncbi:Stage II sporulation protein [Lentibacillus sp. JNUCC-1]|uniref:stage II sporulation protein M n=1 Tax=Lentibacillus sp. JNUCC-1 TaxID=2654513 RepID=UPI0012E75A2D|nr:stage II sporulation protein M [Lentibacillus sp. JNUCC-1]MUV39717.1 Stage II sporulation protein [Lentibacillus sp. JNUCC-1]